MHDDNTLKLLSLVHGFLFSSSDWFEKIPTMSDNESGSHESIKNIITQSISTNKDGYWKIITEVHVIRSLPIPNYDH